MDIENGVKYTDIMVDLETTGTQPDRAGILQIAAVKFNLTTKAVCPFFFNKCLTLPPHRFWSLDTMHWWQQQKKSTLAQILKDAEPYRNVINEFADYSYQNPGLRFWSKPTTFDFMFLASYFSDEGLINPFHYRIATDMNSFLRGLHHPNEIPEIPMQFGEGQAHNALSDTLAQLKLLFAHLETKNDSSNTQG